MQSGNPVLSERAFQGLTTMEYGNQAGMAEAGTAQAEMAQADVMTVQGTAIKTVGLLVLAVAAATFTWTQFTGNPASVRIWMWGGLLGGLALGLATTFKPTWAPITSPFYAAAEGLFLGAISAMYNEFYYEGIVFQAFCLTFGTLFCMLMAYQSGWIQATEKFKMGVAAATGGILIVYLLSFVFSFFGTAVPFIHSNGIIGIGFSLFVVVIAALNLVLDFDFIDRGARAGVPKYMEWYGAFALMVTLVWLYIEILRLLGKLSSRD